MLMKIGNKPEMVLHKTIRCCHLYTFLKLQRSSIYASHLNRENPHPLASSIILYSRSYSSLSSILGEPSSILTEIEEKSQKKKKSLSVFFKEAVRVSKRVKINGHEVGNEGENAEVKEKLRNLAEEVGNLKKVRHEVGRKLRRSGKMEKEGKGRLCSSSSYLKDIDEIQSVNPTDIQKESKERLATLIIEKKMEEMKPEKQTCVGNEPLLNPYKILIAEVRRREEEENLKRHSKKLYGSLRGLISGKETKEDVKLLKQSDSGQGDPMVSKELSSVMEMFAHHLFKEGYFKEVSAVPRNRAFDLSLFDSIHGRGYLKFAACEFGKDRPEIANWLSVGDLKKVVLFGCPSVEKSAVRAAKHTRRFFRIEERQVCRRCPLKGSCKFANMQWGKCYSDLHFGHIIRVLTAYVLESVPENLVVPDEIKTSVERLLKEVINLSQSLSKASPDSISG